MKSRNKAYNGKIIWKRNLTKILCFNANAISWIRETMAGTRGTNQELGKTGGNYSGITVKGVTNRGKFTVLVDEFTNYGNDWRTLIFTDLLPLFINGKWETNKIDCGDKIWNMPCLFTSFVNFDTFSKLQWKGFALISYTIIISVQKLAQVIKSTGYRLPKIHRHNTKIQMRILANNWNKLGIKIYSDHWSKRIFWLIVGTYEMRLLLFLRF